MIGCDTRIALVETPDTGWKMELFRVETSAGDRFSVDVTNPEDDVVFSHYNAKNIDECCESVSNYFANHRMQHTATALVAMCAAELAP